MKIKKCKRCKGTGRDTTEQLIRQSTGHYEAFKGYCWLCNGTGRDK